MDIGAPPFKSQKLLGAEPHDDRAAPEDAHHAKGPEEMQRAGQISQQKTDREQIEEHAEGARNAVVRHAVFAVHVADGNLADRCAMP